MSVLRMGGDPPSPWEGRFGYSRTLRAGQLVLVGGTTSVDEDGVVLGQTAYEQARLIIEKIGHELGRAGASLSDVIQMRVYMTDIGYVHEVGRAHGELLGDVRPVLTGVEVSALIDPRMLVEIEALAWLVAPASAGC